MRHYDVVIVGGGPAGSTVSTLVKLYSPQLKVLLLEKAHFPRHHIGESLLAGGTPVLSEMGVYEKVKQYGFVEKLGATYVWGRDRKPWGFGFDELVTQLEVQGKSISDIYAKAWQVNRGEYDHLLLKHAASVGVEVHEGARVSRVLRAADGERVVGVEYSDERGTHSIESMWLVDCSGQDALLGREMKLREYDELMNNYALWGYWKGAKWKFEYLGHPNLTRIFIATTPRGWLWYIPISREVVSVGFVTHRQTLKGMAHGPEQLYLDEIAACPEVRGLLDSAHLVRIADDQKRDVCSIQDWSYSSRQKSGPGWAMAGDAAGFVDPILSSGVMLAHELGQKAAYTLLSSFSASSDEQIRSYWKFYEETYNTYLLAYKEMAHFWYTNNFSMETWWWNAQRILARQDSSINLTDREAFVRLAFGYAARAESLSLFWSYPIQDARQIVDGLFGANYNPEELSSKYGHHSIRLADSAKLTRGMYYYWGCIRETTRIIGSDKRYIDLHPAEESLLSLLDGSHTLEDLDSAARNIRAHKERTRLGIDLLVQLDNIGALAWN